jgi:hypothetical protein
MSDGRLVIHNAVALDDEEMRELESWGEVAYILVPNGWHRLDCRIWKQRYPNAKLLCPKGSRKRVEQVGPVDGTYEDFPQDESVAVAYVDGIKKVEGVMTVRSPDGTTLVFNDLIFNLSHLPGLFGFVYRLLGSTGGPKVTRISRLFMVKDKAQLRSHLERLAQDESLKRIIPAHGRNIEADPQGTLQSIAAAL